METQICNFLQLNRQIPTKEMKSTRKKDKKEREGEKETTTLTVSRPNETFKNPHT